jgi:hypothetical protein
MKTGQGGFDNDLPLACQHPRSIYYFTLFPLALFYFREEYVKKN